MTLIGKLNGWQRLWVVVSALYGFAVIAGAVALAPKEQDIMSAWVWDVLRVLEEDIKRTSGKQISVSQLKDAERFRGKTEEQIVREVTRGAKEIDLQIPEKKDLGQYKKAVLDLEKSYEEKLSALPAKQREHAGIAFAIWLLPVLAVLGLGYAIGWIYRGFKRE